MSSLPRFGRLIEQERHWLFGLHGVFARVDRDRPFNEQTQPAIEGLQAIGGQNEINHHRAGLHILETKYIACLYEEEEKEDLRHQQHATQLFRARAIEVNRRAHAVLSDEWRRRVREARELIKRYRSSKSREADYEKRLATMAKGA